MHIISCKFMPTMGFLSLHACDFPGNFLYFLEEPTNRSILMEIRLNKVNLATLLRCMSPITIGFMDVYVCTYTYIYIYTHLYEYIYIYKLYGFMDVYSPR